MSTRLRRLERLEQRRQPRGKPWRDPSDATQLWAALEASADAESAGRLFSWLPSEPLSSESQEMLEIRLRESNRTY